MRTARILLTAVSLGALGVGCGPEELEAMNAPELKSIEQGIVVYNTPATSSGQINQAGDTYRHVIDLAYGGKCTFETTLGTLPDSVMWLYDANLGFIQYDDDGGAGYASLIQRTLPPGRYYVDVGGYGSFYTGDYTLNISCQDAVFLHQNFYADIDANQCNGGAYGAMRAGLGEWTPSVRIDTDGRSGGCIQQFSVTDPTGVVSGLQLAVNFYGDGNAEQCNNPGYRQIPVTSSNAPQWSSSYRIDADSRTGGCWQVFYLSGRSDLALDVEFTADGDANQCNYAGTHTVTASNSVAIRIDTDERVGGCRQRFRLRRQ
jgi:hypothetical protein